MRVPQDGDVIRVGAQGYRVHLSPDLAAEDGLSGACNRRRLVIELDSGAHPSRQKQTLLHEILEAIDHEFGVGLEHPQIDALEVALACLVKDNPTLFVE